MRFWLVSVAILAALCGWFYWSARYEAAKRYEAENRLEMLAVASRTQVNQAASAVVDVINQDKVAEERTGKATEIINASVDRVCRAFATNRLLCTLQYSNSSNPTPLGCVPAVASYEPPVGCEPEQ